MVLGLISKSKKGSSLSIEFYIQVQEIRPWSVKLQNAKAELPLVLHWQRGDKRSGNTRAALPEESPDGGRIVFHESFRLPATLYREETKGSTSAAPAKFQKKCVVFSLFETSPKGAKLGTAVLDLADYGSVTTLVPTKIPFALAKKIPSGVPSSLFLAIGRFGNKSSLSRIGSASSRDNPTDDNFAPTQSAADLSSYVEVTEAPVVAPLSDDDEEIAAFTDDEELSPSSDVVPKSSSYPKHQKSVESETSTSSSNSQESHPPEQLHKSAVGRREMEEKFGLTTADISQTPSAIGGAGTAYSEKQVGTSKESSLPHGLSSRPEDLTSKSCTPDSDGSFTSTLGTARLHSTPAKCSAGKSPLPPSGLLSSPPPVAPLQPALHIAAGIPESPVSDDKYASTFMTNQKVLEVVGTLREDMKNSGKKPELKMQAPTAKAISEVRTEQGVPCGQGKFVEDAKQNSSERRVEVDVPRGKSGKVTEDRRLEEKAEGEFRVLQEARARLAKGVDSDRITERFENKALDEAIKKLEIAEAKIEELQKQVSNMSTQLQNSEAELADMAAADIALYSVVPEHGGTPHKLHSPARRLARLYIHAYKLWTLERRAGSAQNSVSAIVSVVRGCGHDVPRLTFWLSNVVVLRETLLQVCSPGASSPNEGRGVSEVQQIRNTDSPSGLNESSCQVSGKEGTAELSTKGDTIADWQELNTYITALEKIEAWIHGRVVECVWWQAMAPPMQRSVELSPLSSPKIDSLDDKAVGTSSSVKGELGDGRQGNISVEIWKKALLKVYGRVCPVRAAGHDCGCLQSLITLIVEQCAARLDVAIFNALLRDTTEYVPTDPISDPIGDASVLPVAPGKLTFGDGAQLKNAVGTWSSWLAGVLGTGDESASGEIYNHDNDVGSVEEVDKGTLYFMLCRATADLLMLPKDILMDKSVRKEVCPALSLPLIRRILSIFEPDEFFPDPVSPSLLAALNAEVIAERRRHGESAEVPESVAMASAPTAAYVPPHPASVREITGEYTDWNKLNRTASIMRKGYTSDDELEDLESPASLMLDVAPARRATTSDEPALIGEMSRQFKGSPRRTDRENGGMNRFRLLREIWALE